MSANPISTPQPPRGTAVSIRAHFDGKTIVPDEPVDLPVDTPLEVKVQLRSVQDLLASVPPRPVPGTVEDRIRAWDEFIAAAKNSPALPLESLRRENMYED